MKGPGYRYDLEIRRVWECPKCGQRLRFLGHVTARRCACDAEGNWMRLVQERFRRTFPEREKIVIPEDAPEEIPPAESPAEEIRTENFFDSDAPSDIFAPDTESETGFPETIEPEPEEAGSPQPVTEAAEDENSPDRRKRRKKRRRKKKRKHQSDTPGGPQQRQDSEPSRPNESPPPPADTDDFGTNVF